MTQVRVLRLRLDPGSASCTAINALRRRVWDSGHGLPVGLFARWTNLPCQPTHLKSPPPVSPATSRYVKSTVGPVFESNLAKLLSAQRDRSSRHLIDLLQPSMKRIAFQRFLTMSEMKSFKVSFVTITVTSWSFIEFCF